MISFDDPRIKEGKSFFSNVKLDPIPTWETELKFLDDHPEDFVDTNTKKFRFFLKSCTHENKLQAWSQELALDLSEAFRKNPITLIKFYGFGVDSDSYPWHADKMDVFLVQSVGDVLLKIENTPYETNGKMFRPGHCVWIPRGTHHQVVTRGSRVTYSYGVEGEPNPINYL